MIEKKLSVFKATSDRRIGFVGGIPHKSVFLRSFFLENEYLSEARIFFPKNSSFDYPFVYLNDFIISKLFFDRIEKSNGKSKKKRLVPADNDKKIIVIDIDAIEKLSGSEFGDPNNIRSYHNLSVIYMTIIIGNSYQKSI